LEFRIQAKSGKLMRRGALLHDIGKMGIPDSILLKPTTLSPQEWETMRLHPVIAYRLLIYAPRSIFHPVTMKDGRERAICAD
jgi:HD-GYP domain-containing protein (c-di-GMP phosphodiesterase class II)